MTTALPAGWTGPRWTAPRQRWHSPARLFLLPMLLMLLGLGGLQAQVILVDGEFGDWAAFETVRVVDPPGDAAAGGVDFRSVEAMRTEDKILIRADFGRETILATTDPLLAGNETMIVLESTSNGNRLELELGRRNARLTSGGVTDWGRLSEAGFRGFPTHSASEFEFRVDRRWKSGLWDGDGPLRIRLVDFASGDSVPDAGWLVLENLAPAFPPAQAVAIGKEQPGDLRILSYNVRRTAAAEQPERAARIIQAIQPDIIAFQELYPSTWSLDDVAEFLDAYYPHGGEGWYLAREFDCVTASRFPITGQLPLSGNIVTTIALPNGETTGNLVLFNAHTPCCDGGNAGRDQEHDQMAAAWREMINGNTSLPVDGARDTVVFAGDFNMVGFARQLRTLQDGDLIDNSVWGPDFSPGRERGSLQALKLRHTHVRDIATWVNLASSYSPGRLDFILFDSPNGVVAKDFALRTETMPRAVLDDLGLEAADTGTLSDHLPLVADIRFSMSATSGLQVY